MQRVFVIDSSRTPLMPCTAARARQLLKAGKAAVFKRYPFTIILKERIGGATQRATLKIDPGSKTTGLAIVVQGKRAQRVVWAAELSHRGQAIRDALLSRRQLRRGRRTRKLRYRPARFDNRVRGQGWLAPSVCSRVANVLTWVNRMAKVCPLTGLAQELVKFDTQIMQNPAISGVAYQQGTLTGYEVREYLLEKWGRTCAYCGKTDVPLEIEHLIPRSRGGSDRVSNLALACQKCNQQKGHQTAAEFGYPQLVNKARQPLKDAAAINATRWELWRKLTSTGLPLEVGTGGRTKFNRIQQGYPKAHWLDAACVGESGNNVLANSDHAPMLIKATGHGSRQMCRTDAYGFPSRYRLRQKRHFGFQTGDIVQARVTAGKSTGKHVGRVACRATGSFDIKTATGKVTTNHTNCAVIHRADGYTYAEGGRAHASLA